MINGKKVLAVVLARYGSKGLPGKNYRPLFNRPLFMWSVLAGYYSKYIDYVALSTCDPSVEECFKKFQDSCCYSDEEVERKQKLALIPRPFSLNESNVKNEPVLAHAHDFMDNYYKFNADIIVTLQPTSPIRTNHLVDVCLRKLEDTKADSLLTVTQMYPFFWEAKGDFVTCPNQYYLDRPMRQDIKNFSWFDNGNVYVTRKEILLKQNNRLGGNVTFVETDRYQSLQIDTFEDFEILETVAKLRGGVL